MNCNTSEVNAGPLEICRCFFAPVGPEAEKDVKDVSEESLDTLREAFIAFLDACAVALETHEEVIGMYQVLVLVDFTTCTVQCDMVDTKGITTRYQQHCDSRAHTYYVDAFFSSCHPLCASQY